MSATAFKRVILYARQHRASQGVHETVVRLMHYLQTQPLALYQDLETARGFGLAMPVLARDDMEASHDLIIVVGGDGSLLSAARIAIERGVPVIGINRGRLGFLTDILPNDMEIKLAAVLAGQYTEERRVLLHLDIYDAHQIYFTGDALNDVVLSRGVGTHLVEFDVAINHEMVNRYRSDGLIISTPTGSTAYALSAGGPIMHPQLNAMLLLPMFSHCLSLRPLVVDGDSLVVLSISDKNEQNLQISCDGHDSSEVRSGQFVRIKKNQHALRLLHPTDYHYYDTLRTKLGWGQG